MDEKQLFVLADRALDDVVRRIGDDQWSMRMPADFQVGSGVTEPPTLWQIINYHAYDDAWVPDVLAGRTTDEADGPSVEDDLLGDRPQEAFSALVERACAAAQALDDPERTAHLTYGDYPAREFLQHVTTFRGLRVHDIDVAIGGDGVMPDDLVEGLWAMLLPEAETWRAMGVFGPAVPVADDAPLQSRLLGLTGRQP